MPCTEKEIGKAMKEMDNSKRTTGEVVSARFHRHRYKNSDYVKDCRSFYRKYFTPRVREKLENIIEKKPLDLFKEFYGIIFDNDKPKEGAALFEKRELTKELADELDLVQMALRYVLSKSNIFEHLELQGKFVPKPINDNEKAACKLNSLIINEIEDIPPRVKLRKVEPVNGKVVLGPRQAEAYDILKEAADPNGIIENILDVKSEIVIRPNICEDLRRLCCVDILKKTKIKKFPGKRISFKLRVLNVEREVFRSGAAIAHRRKEIAQEAQENEKQNQQT